MNMTSEEYVNKKACSAVLDMEKNLFCKELNEEQRFCAVEELKGFFQSVVIDLEHNREMIEKKGMDLFSAYIERGIDECMSTLALVLEDSISKEYIMNVEMMILLYTYFGECYERCVKENVSMMFERNM